MDQKYNGWTNYETWCVHFWLTNDEGSYNYWTKEAKRHEHLHQFMDQLKEELRDNWDGWSTELMGRCSLYSDLLGAALDRVNWHEVAKALSEQGEKGEDPPEAD